MTIGIPSAVRDEMPSLVWKDCR